MSKFIYNVKFISGKAKVAALVKYIATREGVEKITLATGAESLPVTLRQKDKIEELLKMYPDSIDTFEYEDYYANPSMKNASLLISKILEDNAEKYFSSDDYIGYISNRPGVEKNIELGHGLFSSSPVLNLSETKKQIASEAKTLYTTVLSIRREDAARLGYENSDAWQKLIKKNLPHIASNFKIPLKDFKWYAAFHNEGHHPHCHMLVYSVGKSAYVNKKSISKIKSAIATDIFQDELLELYNSQQREIELASLRTTSILTGAEELSPEGQKAISNKIVLLSKHLQNHKGRKVYGYLSKDAKAIVDDIFNVLASEPDVKEAYDRYLDFKDKQHLIYHSPATLPQHKAITEDYKFKKIKNIIIKEAAHLADSFIDEDEFLDVDLPGILPGEIESAETADLAYAKDEEPAEPEIESAETADEAHTDDFDIHDSFDESTDEMLKKFAAKIINDNFCLSFFANKADKASYYSAKKAVYRETNTERRQAALNSLIKMAINGNVYAAYDIASFLASGAILEKNEELSQEVYKRVLKTLSDKYEKSRDSYIAYRLGKMYLYGLGCDKDIAKAVEYITPAAEAGNSYAAYRLGCIYSDTSYEGYDIEKAYSYFKQSYEADGNLYAKRKMDRLNSQANFNNSSAAIYIFNSFLRLFDDSSHETNYHKINNTTDLLERIKRGEKFTYDNT